MIRVVEAKPQHSFEGNYVVFDDETGQLYIEGLDGITTLSKESAKQLADMLVRWAGAAVGRCECGKLKNSPCFNSDCSRP